MYYVHVKKISIQFWHLYCMLPNILHTVPIQYSVKHHTKEKNGEPNVLDLDVLLTHFGIWMLVESNDKPYAGQPVGNKAEEYHQQAQYNSTILGQPKHKYISLQLRQMKA